MQDSGHGRDSTGNRSCVHPELYLLDPAFGRCPLAVGSTANILSQAAALDAGFQVQYADDTFIVSHPTKKDTRYVFGRSTGTHGSTKHYLMDCRTMLPPVSARTSTYILMGYEPGVYTTKKELELEPPRTTFGPYVRAGISHNVGQHGKPEHFIRRVIKYMNSVTLKDGHSRRESSPFSFNMERSAKWNGSLHNRRTRRSPIVNKLPSLDPYPFLNVKDYPALLVSMGKPQDYPLWSLTSGDAQSAKKRSYKLTIIPEISDGMGEARREETISCL